MCKWLVRGGILLLIPGAILASLYEAATHVGRGYLCGEAFFEDRPTSYWRGRIDRWLTQYESPEVAGAVLANCVYRRCGDNVFLIRFT